MVQISDPRKFLEVLRNLDKITDTFLEVTLSDIYLNCSKISNSLRVAAIEGSGMGVHVIFAVIFAFSIIFLKLRMYFFVGTHLLQIGLSFIIRFLSSSTISA